MGKRVGGGASRKARGLLMESMYLLIYYTLLVEKGRAWPKYKLGGHAVGLGEVSRSSEPRSPSSVSFTPVHRRESLSVAVNLSPTSAHQSGLSAVPDAYSLSCLRQNFSNEPLSQAQLNVRWRGT